MCGVKLLEGRWVISALKDSGNRKRKTFNQKVFVSIIFGDPLKENYSKLFYILDSCKLSILYSAV